MPARNPETENCRIDGCTRAVRTGYLCREHQRLVPFSETTACLAAVMQASHLAARKFHRKWLRDVRGRIAAGEAE